MLDPTRLSGERKRVLLEMTIKAHAPGRLSREDSLGCAVRGWYLKEVLKDLEVPEGALGWVLLGVAYELLYEREEE